MKPYTDTINKCILPVAGKPLLHHNLLQCLQAASIISEIIFVVGYRWKQIHSCFGTEFQGTNWNLVLSQLERKVRQILPCFYSAILDFVEYHLHNILCHAFQPQEVT